MKTCKICGCSFDEENFEGVVVNEGIDNEYHVCCAKLYAKSRISKAGLCT